MICTNCGENTLVKGNLKGKQINWRGTHPVILKKDFITLVCNNCGDFYINRDQSKLLDKAIIASMD